jgi:hypothetical protein
VVSVLSFDRAKRSGLSKRRTAPYVGPFGRAISAFPHRSCFAPSARRTLPAYAGVSGAPAHDGRVAGAEEGVEAVAATTAARAASARGNRMERGFSPEAPLFSSGHR